MNRSRRKLSFRTKQKQTVRIVYAAGSMLAITAMIFIYLNLSGSKESKADVTPAIKPDYTTTSDIIPSRLLLKSDSRTAIELRVKAASDTLHANRIGRSMHISADSYITD